jgi:hypothetical protein
LKVTIPLVRKEWRAVSWEASILVLMVAGLIAAVFLYLNDRRNLKLEAIRLEKMRNSDMYQELTDIVRRCRKRYVEQVIVRRECVEFKMMVPAGRRVIFSLESRGYRPLSFQRLHTLCMLLGQEIPLLADKSRYTLRKVKKPLPNGEKAVEYIYTMRIDYKDALNRAPYYMQS